AAIEVLREEAEAVELLYLRRIDDAIPVFVVKAGRSDIDIHPGYCDLSDRNARGARMNESAATGGRPHRLCAGFLFSVFLAVENQRSQIQVMLRSGERLFLYSLAVAAAQTGKYIRVNTQTGRLVCFFSATPGSVYFASIWVDRFALDPFWFDHSLAGHGHSWAQKTAILSTYWRCRELALEHCSSICNIKDRFFVGSEIIRRDKKPCAAFMSLPSPKAESRRCTRPLL